MKRITSHLSMLVLAVFAVSAVAVVPVSARPDDTHNPGDGQVRTAHSASNDRQHAAVEAATLDDIKQRGDKLVSEERKGKPAKAVERRQKSCEARKANLTKKMDSFTGHADRHLATFDKIYARVKTFQEEKKLDAANYDELVAVADEKQKAAAEAVDALAEVTVEVDCAAEDPAVAVASVKTAVQDTRTALKDYRTAIKDVVKALKASVKETAEENDGGTSDDTGSTDDSSTGDASTDDSTDGAVNPDTSTSTENN